MPSPYSAQLRERALAAYEAGKGTQQEIADLFSIGIATVRRWVALQRRTGGLAPMPHGGGQTSRVDESVLHRLVAEDPDATSYELTATYNRNVARNAKTSRSSVQRALARAGYVRKKNGRVLRSKIGPTSK